MKILSFVIVVSSLAFGWAAGVADSYETTAGGRDLLQFRPLPTFPYAKCQDFSTTGQPYYLTDVSTSIDDNDVAQYSFAIKYKGDKKNPSKCYKELSDSLHKVMFHIYTECVPAIEVAGKYATVNGKRKSLLLYPNPTGTALTLSALNLNSSTAENTIISIRAAAPCNQPNYFFKPNAVKGVPIEYAFTESGAHHCCGLNEA